MLNALFVNASILITFLYLGSQLYVSDMTHPTSDKKTHIAFGIMFGICGCILMFNGIHLTEHMLMDFRILALIISVIYCGPLSATVTAIIIILFRMGYFGINPVSVTASVNLLVLLGIFTTITLSQMSFQRKFILMCLANILSSFVLSLATVKNPTLRMTILLFYPASTAIVSAVIYYTLRHINKTNGLYLKFKEESTIDYLTGLINVREFDALLDRFVAIARERKKYLSLLMLDLDRFKVVNDTYGHYSGDLVLKQVSDLLAQSCRSFDMIARKGGEEFAIILLDCDSDHAVEIAERIRKHIEEFTFSIENDVDIHITISIGISTYHGGSRLQNNLVDEADKALYLAKNNGRNQVHSLSAST